jgi:hypothetical protein
MLGTPLYIVNQSQNLKRKYPKTLILKDSLTLYDLRFNDKPPTPIRVKKFLNDLKASL